MERLDLRKLMNLFGGAPVGKAAGSVSYRLSKNIRVHQGQSRTEELAFKIDALEKHRSQSRALSDLFA
jgi:hypothetical protein